MRRSDRLVHVLAVAFTLGVFAVGMLVQNVLAEAPPLAPSHFLHAAHATRGVEVTKCEGCHKVDPKGQVLAPAAQGHAPCLQSSCHATQFLAVGNSEKTRKLGPAFDKAQAFCLGCHEVVPTPWSKPPTRIRPSFKASREYHIEMNHYEHAVRANAKGTRCTGCHAVDARTFDLVVGTPGHAQCMTCHNAKDYPDFTMSQCGLCHRAPSRTAYNDEQMQLRGIKKKASRPDSTVRSCGSEAHTRLLQINPKAPCFKHERVEHRTDTGKADGPLQCAKCHYVVADKALGKQYRSLFDLRTKPIIDNNKDRQHASCGRSGCHVSETRASSCAESFCHADLSVY